MSKSEGRLLEPIKEQSFVQSEEESGISKMMFRSSKRLVGRRSTSGMMGNWGASRKTSSKSLAGGGGGSMKREPTWESFDRYAFWRKTIGERASEILPWPEKYPWEKNYVKGGVWGRGR